MALTDRDVARLVRSIYAKPDFPVTSWDRLDRETRNSAICWGVKIVDDVAVAVFRGSFEPRDWVLDLEAWAWPTRLGLVHFGFQLGTRTVARKLLDWMTERGLTRVIVAGHSLGAAHARLVAAWLARDGIVPLACLGWGEPLSGFRRLSRLSHGIPNSRTYVNADGRARDGVTLVPTRFWLFRYQCPVERVLIRNRPATLSLIDPFGLHHVRLYEAATPDRVIVS